MKRTGFSIMADVAFYAVCAFSLTFCALRYFKVPLAITLTVSIAICLAAGCLSFLFLEGKNKKRVLSKREEESRDALLLHLALEKPERVRAELLEAYLADGKEAHCDGEELTVRDMPVVPLFSLEPISADEIAKLIRRFGRTRFEIDCNTLSPQAEKLALSFGIEIKDKNEIASLFSRTGKTPNPLICGEIPRRTVRQRLFRAFSKSNARPFFVSGMLLLFMSLFTFFPVVYILSGSLLLAGAILIRLVGYSA